MKMLKQKLFASLAMLLVATTMMGTSTYAWFAISIAPEVDGVATAVQANQAFEIAWGDTAPGANSDDDTGDYGTWGALVVYTDEFDAAGLGPAAMASGLDGLDTVDYGTDGRPAGSATADTTDAGNGVTTYADANGNQVGFSYDVMIRTNVAGDAYLNVATPTDLPSELDGYLLVTAVIDDTDEVTLTLDSETTIISSMVAGTAYNVTIYAYLDGENMDNAVMGFDTVAAGGVTFDSIVFSHSAIEDYTNSYTGTTTTT